LGNSRFLVFCRFLTHQFQREHFQQTLSIASTHKQERKQERRIVIISFRKINFGFCGSLTFKIRWNRRLTVDGIARAYRGRTTKSERRKETGIVITRETSKGVRFPLSLPIFRDLCSATLCAHSTVTHLSYPSPSIPSVTISHIPIPDIFIRINFFSDQTSRSMEGMKERLIVWMAWS